MSPRTRLGVVLGLLAFCAIEGLVVSVPDYPYHAAPWQIQLWGEPTQWWSEVAWILTFTTAGISILVLGGWSEQLKASPKLRFVTDSAFLLVVVSWISFSFAFVAVYSPALPSTFKDLLLDRGGMLHGLFYLGATHLVAASVIMLYRVLGQLVESQSIVSMDRGT